MRNFSIKIFRNTCCRKAYMAGVHHWSSDWWPSVFCQHWWAGCYGWRTCLSVSASIAAFHFTALALLEPSQILRPQELDIFMLMICLFIDYIILKKLIVHGNEDLYRFNIRHFTYFSYLLKNTAVFTRKWWKQNLREPEGLVEGSTVVRVLAFVYS